MSLDHLAVVPCVWQGASAPLALALEAEGVAVGVLTWAVQGKSPCGWAAWSGRRPPPRYRCERAWGPLHPLARVGDHRRSGRAPSSLWVVALLDQSYAPFPYRPLVELVDPLLLQNM